MSSAPVTLDFSKAIPIDTKPAPSGGVTLDFSKAQPLAGQSSQPQSSDPNDPYTNPNSKPTPDSSWMYGEDGTGATNGRWISAADRLEASRLGWRDQAPTEFEQSDGHKGAPIAKQPDTMSAAPAVGSMPWIKGKLYETADTVSNVLPSIGGAVGGALGAGSGAASGAALGGIGAAPGAFAGGVVGAGLGSAAGESAKQLMRRAAGFEDAPETSSAAAGAIGDEGMTQMTLQATGEGIGAAGALSVNALKGLKSLTPAEEAAVRFGQARGVPIDAATATGNRYVRGVQALTEQTPAGSIVTGPARRAQTSALASTAGDLASAVSPTAQTAESAGSAVTDAMGKASKVETHALSLEGRHLSQAISPSAQVPESAGNSVAAQLNKKISDLNTSADAAYSQFRKLEQNPANIKSVTLDGKPTQMGLPVDMREIKAALQPMYDDMQMWMEPARRNASAGYQALKSITQGPDFMPASVAERGLGGLKSLARGAANPDLRDVSEGIGALGAKKLQGAIDQAVGEAAEPDALATLQNARNTNAQKMAVGEVLGSLREEPVQLFKQAVWANDAGINQLREVAKLAPDEMAKIGRAYWDGLLAKAGSTDGFKGIASDWNSLGPETKQILFGNKTRALDNFVARTETSGISDLFSSMRKEPVGVFNQATMAKDAGIVQLRRIAAVAPNEMPKVGRAYLENLFTKATDTGGFDHADKLFSEWQNLGPETKKILFRNPQQISDLDNFFLLAKKIRENPNPSGSGYMAQIVAHGTTGIGLTLYNPAAGATYFLAPAAIAKLMYSPKAVRAIMNGMQTPATNYTAAALAAGRIANAAGDSMQKVSDDQQQSQ